MIAIKVLLLGLLIAVAPMLASATADPCAQAVPPTLRKLLLQKFPNERLPLSTDSNVESRQPTASGESFCLLVAEADFDGDGRIDMALLLPAKNGRRYRLVAALNQMATWQLTSVLEWPAPYGNLFVSTAPPGIYRHTESYAFIPDLGAAEQVDARQPGFYFGEVEGGADVYVLKSGHWVHVHSID